MQNDKIKKKTIKIKEKNHPSLKILVRKCKLTRVKFTTLHSR